MQEAIIELVTGIAKDLLFVSTITTIEIPMLTKMNKVDYDNLLKKRISNTAKEEKSNVDEKIKPLLKRIEEKTNKNNIKYINKNISNLKINKDYFLLLKGWTGSYNVKDNKVNIVNDDALYHEIFHVLSGEYDKSEDTIYDGFLVSNKNGKVGIGLNEGYTEYKAATTFRNGKVKAYKKEVKLAKIVEKFFYNKKDMEEYYYRHNLPEFIYYMSQYADKEEVKSFIKDYDLMTNTNKLLSQSPNYYYIKNLIRLNKWSESNNLSPNQKNNIKQLIKK